MTFGATDYRPGQADEALSHQILDAFVEAGGNFIDTADVYQRGLSEEIIGNWLEKRVANGLKRDKIILATKVAGVMRDDDKNGMGLSRHHIMTNVEESLARLKVDYIDLLYVHIWDSATPIEETLYALNDLVRSGKVRYIGASNFTGWQVMLASLTAQKLGLSKFICLQEQYNLLVRQIEWEVTDACAREGVGLIPWSPLKGGWLSGKMKKDQSAPSGSRVAFSQETGKSNQSAPSYDDFGKDPRTWRTLEQCEVIGKKYGKTVAQVAIRWLLEKPNVPSVIIGVKNLTQLKDNLGAIDFKLTEDDMKALDEASDIPLPYPYEMITRSNKVRL